MKINIKSFVSGIVIGTVLTASLSAFAAVKLNVIPNPYPIFIDGVKSKIKGYKINGTVHISINDLKTLGISNQFNEEKQQIEIKTTSNINTKQFETSEKSLSTENSSNTNSIASNTKPSNNVDGFLVYSKDNNEYISIDKLTMEVNTNNIEQNEIKSSDGNIRYIKYCLVADYSKSDSKAALYDSIIFYIEKTGLDINNGQTIKQKVQLCNPLKLTYFQKGITLQEGCVEISEYKKYLQPLLTNKLSNVFNDLSK
jgi:hypothetical protein